MKSVVLSILRAFGFLSVPTPPEPVHKSKRLRLREGYSIEKFDDDSHGNTAFGYSVLLRGEVVAHAVDTYPSWGYAVHLSRRRSLTHVGCATKTCDWKTILHDYFIARGEESPFEEDSAVSLRLRDTFEAEGYPYAYLVKKGADRREAYAKIIDGSTIYVYPNGGPDGKRCGSMFEAHSYLLSVNSESPWEEV